jgi:hypothetical protein
MRLPRMTTRRWMVVAALVALTCGGLFGGSPRVATATLVFLIFAPVVLTFSVLARRLGLNTLFR